MKPRAQIALMVIAFVIISIGLTWLWNEWLSGLYGRFFTTIAPPIYDAIGLGHARAPGLRQRYINFVPFVALILVTRGLTLRRRTIGLLAGLITISISHLLLNLTALIQPGPALPVMASVVSDAFPFLVWFVVAYPAISNLIPGASTKEIPEP
jgi:hypothetical protein